MNTPVFIMCVLAAASAHLVTAHAGQRNYTSRASIVLGNNRERAPDAERCPALALDAGVYSAMCAHNDEPVECGQPMATGSSAAMTCRAGFVIAGRTTSSALTTCLNNAEWRTELRCVKEAPRCPALTMAAGTTSLTCALNGQVVNCSRPMTSGTTAEMSCGSKYVIAGVTAAATTCLQDASWNYALSCVPAQVAATTPAPTCPTCPTCPTLPPPTTCPTCPTLPPPTTCPPPQTCPTLPPPTTCPPPQTCPTQPPTTTTTPPPMLPGYTRIPGVGCYKFHTAALEWSDAKVMCESEGGHLAVLNSQAEADAVENLYKQNRERITGATNRYNTWLGVRESLTTDGDFYTIFGERLSDTGFTRWWPGFPYYKSSLGDVVFLSGGSLRDRPVSSNYKFAFACEQRHC